MIGKGARPEPARGYGRQMKRPVTSGLVALGAAAALVVGAGLSPSPHQPPASAWTLRRRSSRPPATMAIRPVSDLPSTGGCWCWRSHSTVRTAPSFRSRSRRSATPCPPSPRNGSRSRTTPQREWPEATAFGPVAALSFAGTTVCLDIISTVEPQDDGALVRTAESWEGEAVEAQVETRRGARWIAPGMAGEPQGTAEKAMRRERRIARQLGHGEGPAGPRPAGAPSPRGPRR